MNGRRQFIRGKTHRRDVITVAMFQPAGIRFHQVDRRLDRIRHVHHVQPRPLVEKALIAPVPRRRMEDMHRVVGRAAGWRRLVRNQPRITHTARVDPEVLMVIVAQQFAADFGYPVHGIGALDRILRGVFLRSRRPEGTNGTGKEHRALMHARDVQHVHQAAHVHFPCALRFFLGIRREQ